MINCERYITQLILHLKKQFDSRLIYVGLQGSYLRGEATADSDIDIMVIIDKLNVTDLADYRSIIQAMAHFDKSCGFICSKEDMANWNPLEICNLLNTTQDYHGRLQDLVPVHTKEDIRNFIKLSINNLYHELCHRYIHADLAMNNAKLPITYKSVFFILQNLYYLKHGKFVGTKAELLPLLDGINHRVLQRLIELNNGVFHNFPDSFELLFTWCQRTQESL